MRSAAGSRSSKRSAAVPIRCCGSTCCALPAFAVANLVAFATNFALFAVFFFTALYLELIANFSGWKIALQFVAMAAAMAVAGIAAGRITARFGPREPMVVGCFVAGGGMFAVDALLNPHPSLPLLAGALAIVGIGFGLALVTVTAAVLNIVPAERSGTAASTINTSRELGGVLGVAVLGAIVNSQLNASLTRQLKQLGIPAELPRLHHQRGHARRRAGEPAGCRASRTLQRRATRRSSQR